MENMTVTTARKDGISIGFIGHVDAGKSTLCGKLLIATGTIPAHEVRKLMKTASKDNFSHISGIMDIIPEERDRGKTFEYNKEYFQTKSKKITVIDTPGHKTLIANMIEGIARANVVVLVVSARENEFENGFEQGDTKEHLVLARTSGIKKIVVLVNKMDTVCWSKERFDECRESLTSFLKKLWSNKDFTFIPCSGTLGIGLTAEHGDVCSWYEGPTFVTFLDEMPVPGTEIDEEEQKEGENKEEQKEGKNKEEQKEGENVAEPPFAMFVAHVSAHGKNCTVVEGKIELGKVGVNQKVFLMPNKTRGTVLKLLRDDVPSNELLQGENGQIFVKIDKEDGGVEEISMVCSDLSVVLKGRLFLTEMHIINPGNVKKKNADGEMTNPIITPGYSAMMHFSCASEQITVENMRDKKTKQKILLLKSKQTAMTRIECKNDICVLEEMFFALRNANDANCRTVAMGKILKKIK